MRKTKKRKLEHNVDEALQLALATEVDEIALMGEDDDYDDEALAKDDESEE